jgi:GNAT superfamily N-acetyltransferase
MECDDLICNICDRHPILISVRAAKLGDGVHLLEATLTLAKHHGWEDTVKATPQTLEAAIFKAEPIVGAFLAFDEAAFAGSIVWHRSFSTNRGCEVIYLEDLVVMPNHRRKGVADALMKELAKHAVSQGYPSIYWMMMNWNSGAKDYYSRLGAEAETDSSIYYIHSDALKRLAR